MAADGIQIDDGEFTRLHNGILEKLALARFTASEYRCLMFLFRSTYGWQKKEDVISLSQWAKGVGIDTEKRHNVLRTLQALLAKRVIYSKQHGNNHAATWGFNKHFADWDASLFEETVISPDNTSVMPDDNTPAQTVITEDNTSVISPDNKTVISPDNHKRKKEILKKKGESASAPPARVLQSRNRGNSAVDAITFKSPHVDNSRFDLDTGYIAAGQGTTAVEVYYERFDVAQKDARLNAIKEDDLAKLCTDLDKLREVVVAYSRTSYQPGNLKLILDWYKTGIPEKHRAPPPNGVYKNGAVSEEAKAAIRTRAKLALGELQMAQKFKGDINPQWQRDIDKARELGVL